MTNNKIETDAQLQAVIDAIVVYYKGNCNSDFKLTVSQLLLGSMAYATQQLKEQKFKEYAKSIGHKLPEVSQ